MWTRTRGMILMSTKVSTIMHIAEAGIPCIRSLDRLKSCDLPWHRFYPGHSERYSTLRDEHLILLIDALSIIVLVLAVLGFSVWSLTEFHKGAAGQEFTSVDLHLMPWWKPSMIASVLAFKFWPVAPTWIQDLIGRKHPKIPPSMSSLVKMRTKSSIETPSISLRAFTHFRWMHELAHQDSEIRILKQTILINLIVQIWRKCHEVVQILKYIVLMHDEQLNQNWLCSSNLQRGSLSYRVWNTSSLSHE